MAVCAAAAVVVVLAVLAPARAADARTGKPVVLSFVATPLQPDSTGGFRGGPVTLRADVSGAATCTFSAPRVPGLPSAADCSGGSAAVTVDVPYTRSKVPTTLRFTLTVADTAGVTTKKSVSDGFTPSIPLSGITKIAGNSDSHCALAAAGGVECWGANTDGQTGHGTDVGTTPVARPVLGLGTTGNLQGATDIVNTGQGYCVLLVDQSVACWGDNSLGQLGNGNLAGPATCTSGNACSKVPLQVPLNAQILYPGVPLSTAVASITGLGSGGGVCAALVTGYALCWGSNQSGALAQGSLTGPDTCTPGSHPCTADVYFVLARPCLVGCLSAPLDHVQQIVSEPGDASYCALLDYGYPYCWGDNVTGQLGVGSGDPAVPYATNVVGILAQDHLYHALQIVGEFPATVTLQGTDTGDVGFGYCARLEAGSVACWGDNDDGQLGIGYSSGPSTCQGVLYCSPVPVLVHVAGGGPGLLDGTTDIAGAAGAYCAVLPNGGVACWGADAGGALGVGPSGPANVCGLLLCSYLPAPVVGTGGTGALLHVAALTSDGGTFCATLTAGSFVDCWGLDNYGQAGSSLMPPNQLDHPGTVLGPGGKGHLTGVSSLLHQVTGAPATHTLCGTVSGGTAVCWGAGSSGQIGDGGGVGRDAPATVIWIP